MEAIQYNGQTIMSANEGVIEKQFSFQKLLINVTGLLFGIALILVAVYWQTETGTTYMLLVTIGVCLALVFGVLLFTRVNAIVYLPTRSVMKKAELYFKSGELENLINAVKTGNIETLERLRAERNSGVKMEVIYSKDSSYATCQLFTYVPYNYEPASKVYNLTDEKSQKFCQSLKAMQ